MIPPTNPIGDDDLILYIFGRADSLLTARCEASIRTDEELAARVAVLRMIAGPHSPAFPRSIPTPNGSARNPFTAEPPESLFQDTVRSTVLTRRAETEVPGHSLSTDSSVATATANVPFDSGSLRDISKRTLSNAKKLTDSSAAVDERAIEDFLLNLDAVSDSATRSEAIDVFARRYPHLVDVFRVYAPDFSTPPRRLGLGTQLGDFKIERLVATGGMGEVYEARQDRLNRLVALKVIRRTRTSPAARLRFEREQQALARLHQTHIVPIFAAGEEGDIQYFAMEFIRGVTLNRVVESVYDRVMSKGGDPTPSLGELARPDRACEAGTDEFAVRFMEQRPVRDPGVLLRLSPNYFRSVAHVMAQAADAVQHAHNAGVCHRDLKPSNLMVDENEQCWIIDFGLAGHIAGDAAEASTHGDEALTHGPMGTTQYMAPEQYDGKPAFSSDVWGLGATLYELLTLRRAFDGPSRREVELLVRTATPRPPSELVRGVPSDLAAICRKALRGNPADRYRAPGEFAADLRRWLRFEPTQARGALPIRRTALWSKRNPGWAAALLVTCVLLFGAAVWWVAHAGEWLEPRCASDDQLELLHTGECRP